MSIKITFTTIVRRFAIRLLAGVALAGAAPTPLSLSVAFGSEPPIKEVFSARFGGEVQRITKVPVCTAEDEKREECQQATESGQPGGLRHAEGVGGGSGPEGRVYVADGANHRVQVLTSSGRFILMFGEHVNQTTGENICTAKEVEKGVTCQAGIEGTGAGQFTFPQSIAVDQSNDDVYVAEANLEGRRRVQKFTREGQFLLEVGKEVNLSPVSNLCTAAEITKCSQAAITKESESREPGSFTFPSGQGDTLAIGGPEHHLFVGDTHALQEFRSNGTWTGEPLTKSETIDKRLEAISSAAGSGVSRIAVDETGVVFLGYSVKYSAPDAIRVFDQSGKETQAFPIAGGTFVLGMAVDPADRLAVIENTGGMPHGALYEASSTKLHLLTEFLLNRMPAPPEVEVNVDAITFNGNDELYGAGDDEREVIAYRPVPVAELILLKPFCVEGTVQETSVTMQCKLNGEVNPENVSETEAWFRWGTTPAMGRETPKQSVPTGKTPVTVEAAIAGLRPNEPLYVQLAGEDQNVKKPELLTGEPGLFQTPAVRPRIVGPLSVSFVRYSTVDMTGALNPENSNTRYFFEYIPADGQTLAERCPRGATIEDCAGVSTTSVRESEGYSKIKTTIEATGLQPSTEYYYRLVGIDQVGTALDENGQLLVPEGAFKTAALPIPQATTGYPGAIGPTSAVLTGTVDPNGQPSTFSFQITTGNGTNTEYSTVFTGSTGSGSEPLNESVVLTSLNPGSQYAYRIVITNGFGQTAGLPASFTTPPLVVLSEPPAVKMLLTPIGSFPCQPEYIYDNHHRCVRAEKPAVKKQRKHHRRAKHIHRKK